MLNNSTSIKAKNALIQKRLCFKRNDSGLSSDSGELPSSDSSVTSSSLGSSFTTNSNSTCSHSRISFCDHEENILLEKLNENVVGTPRHFDDVPNQSVDYDDDQEEKMDLFEGDFTSQNSRKNSYHSDRKWNT